MGDETCAWLVAYTNGKRIEQSRDKFNWFDLDHEPTIGDGWYYRIKDRADGAKIATVPKDYG